MLVGFAWQHQVPPSVFLVAIRRFLAIRINSWSKTGDTKKLFACHIAKWLQVLIKSQTFKKTLAATRKRPLKEVPFMVSHQMLLLDPLT
jgi:hypothetical protein